MARRRGQPVGGPPGLISGSCGSMWLACSLLPNGLAGSPRLRVSAARLERRGGGRALASQLSHAASLRPPARRNSCTCRRRASWISRSGGTADRTAPCTSTPNKTLIFPIGERRVAVLAAQACSQVVVVTTDYCHNDSQAVRRPLSPGAVIGCPSCWLASLPARRWYALPGEGGCLPQSPSRGHVDYGWRYEVL